MRARTKANYHKLNLGNRNEYIRLQRGPKIVKGIFARCINYIQKIFLFPKIVGQKNYNVLCLDSQIRDPLKVQDVCIFPSCEPKNVFIILYFT